MFALTQRLLGACLVTFTAMQLAHEPASIRHSFSLPSLLHTCKKLIKSENKYNIKFAVPIFLTVALFRMSNLTIKWHSYHASTDMPSFTRFPLCSMLCYCIEMKMPTLLCPLMIFCFRMTSTTNMSHLLIS